MGSGHLRGTSEELCRKSETLGEMREEYASIYAERTGAAVGQVRRWMAEETWFNAEDSVAHGFADEINGRAQRMIVTIDDAPLLKAPIEACRLAPLRRPRLADARARLALARL